MSNSAIRLLASTWNILGGERNKWLPNIRVIVGADYSRFAASTRQRRDSAGASVNELMENWRAQGLGFDEVLNIELNSYHHSRIEALKALRKNYERAEAAGDMMAIMNHSMRSEEHTSELQSLMRISYAVFCLKKKKYKKLD